MDILTTRFEKRWCAIFLFMYLLIMIPFPFFFNTTYQPGWFGVPVFVYGWLIHGIIVVALILLFAYQCLQRPEYQNLHDEDPPQEQKI